MTTPTIDAPDAPEASALLDLAVGFDGGAVKALGDGRIEGYLVRYGSPEEADVEGEFFAGDTYFGKSESLDIYYEHGCRRRKGDRFWPVFANRPIGDGAIKSLADGRWFSGQLDLDLPGAADLYAEIEAGRMGWSSGSTERLVQRIPVKSRLGKVVRKIARWPLTEATITPMPVDPRNRIYAIKSLPDDVDGDASDPSEEREAVAAKSLLDALSKLVADAEEIVPLLEKAASQRQSDPRGRTLSRSKLDAVKSVVDVFGRIHQGCSGVYVAESLPDLDLDLALLDAFRTVHNLK